MTPLQAVLSTLPPFPAFCAMIVGGLAVGWLAAAVADARARRRVMRETARLWRGLAGL